MCFEAGHGGSPPFFYMRHGDQFLCLREPRIMELDPNRTRKIFDCLG